MKELGSVVQHGNGWRVQVKLAPTVLARGPLRIDETAAQADLEQARAASTREEMQEVLKELVGASQERAAQVVTQEIPSSAAVELAWDSEMPVALNRRTWDSTHCKSIGLVGKRGTEIIHLHSVRQQSFLQTHWVTSAELTQSQSLILTNLHG